MEHSIGKTIANLRKENKLTQTELAEKLGVSDKAVSKWESEGGLPDTMLFPHIANIFGVSIDYLMTGKNVEPEVIFISKTEWCAKNDDVTIFKNIPTAHFSVKDEEGKNLFDYVWQYESLNVFSAMVDRGGWIHRNFGINKCVKLLVLINRIDANSLKRIGLNTLNHLSDNEVDDGVIEAILYDKRVKQETRDYFLSIHLTERCNWSKLYRLFFKKAIEHKDWETVERLCDGCKEGYKLAKENPHLYVNQRCFLEKDILLALLEKAPFELAEKMNSVFGGLTEYDFKMARLRRDPSVSEEEIIVQSLIHDDIVIVDELLATNNFELIKKVLYNYPIHKFEIHYSKFMGLHGDSDNKSWMESAIRVWESSHGSNREYLVLRGKSNPQRNVQSIFEYIKACKEQIISDCALKMDKETLIGDLTKEYFESELSKGNIDIVIIKLCARLEAVLKSDYHYEGALSEMIQKYCDEELHWNEDDGWGYMIVESDKKTIRLLNNLIIIQNSIIHPEKTIVELTMEELRDCIDYICQMG